MGFEGLSQPRHPDLAVWRNQRQKATALSSRQGLSAIGIAARSWLDCQSFSHLSLANNRKRSPRSDSALGGPASRHGQTYQLGSMKISSQLENNFDYCSTEKPSNRHRDKQPVYHHKSLHLFPQLPPN